MSRDRELVDEVRKILQDEGFSSPSLQDVPGEWYLFEREGQPYWVEQVIDGFVSADGSSMEWYRQEGWKLTPVLVHKVISFR